MLKNISVTLFSVDYIDILFLIVSQHQKYNPYTMYTPGNVKGTFYHYLRAVPTMKEGCEPPYYKQSKVRGYWTAQ